MPIDETENWYRERKVDPEKCVPSNIDKGVHNLANNEKGWATLVKEGGSTEIVLCKLEACRKEEGKDWRKKCRPVVQSMRRSKADYTVKNGIVVPKKGK